MAVNPLDIVNAATGFLGFGYNVFANERANHQQQRQLELENQRYIEERDYNRALQQTIFEREDTAIQRAAMDAEKAGFSPLTVAGNGSASGAVVGSSYQSPGSAPGAGNPVDTMALVRGLQEMSLAEDANERADRQVNAQIAFQQASLDMQKEKMGMDFALQTSKAFNDYMLGLENLRQSDRRLSSEEKRFEKELVFKVNQMTNENMRWASDFAREGVWRDRDFSRLLELDKWKKGQDVQNSILGIGSFLLDMIPGLGTMRKFF